MTINLKAIYTQGIFKPLEPFLLRDNQTVTLQVTLPAYAPVASDDFASLHGIWRDATIDWDAGLDQMRQRINQKLEHLLHDIK